MGIRKCMILVLDKLCTRAGITSVPQGYKYRTLHLLMGLYWKCSVKGEMDMGVA